MRTIQVHSELPIDALQGMLISSLTKGEMFRFITALDHGMLDWDLTEKLSLYFEDKMAEFKREEATMEMDEPEW